MAFKVLGPLGCSSQWSANRMCKNLAGRGRNELICALIYTPSRPKEPCSAGFAFILINLQYNEQNRDGTALASNKC